jgi:type II secretory pathway pseudopilin PulG
MVSCRRHRPVATHRGVTLVEAGAVTALLAVVAGGLLLLGSPSDARLREDALRNANVIREAVREWKDQDGVGCPTLTQLQRDERLDRNAVTADPWGNRFRVVCEDGVVSIVAAGRDAQLGNDDDIRVVID